MDPSPLPVLADSSSEGLVPDAPLRPAAEGMEELNRVYSNGLFGAVFSKPTRNRSPSAASARLRWEHRRNPVPHEGYRI